MSVVIKLQHLPVTATSHDIRHFFRSLSIPDGGVHIVGGTEGDVFIIFSTDEDARQAMLLNGSCLKDSPVTLSLSSGYEMSQVIEQTYHKALRTMKSLYKNKSSSSIIQSPPPPQIIPGSSTSALDCANSFIKNNPPPSITSSNNNPHPPRPPSPFASGFVSVTNNNSYLPTTMTTTTAAMVNHNFPGNLMVTQGQGSLMQGPPPLTNLFSQAPPQRNPYGLTIYNNMNNTNSSDSCTNAGMGFSGYPMSSNGQSLMNYPHRKPVMNGPWIHSFGSNHHTPHPFMANNNNDNFPPGRHANHTPPNSRSNFRRNINNNNNNGPYRYGTVNRNGRRRPSPWIKMNHNNNISQ